ncbi:hypothetical protein QAD02_010368 [Eretmocerus hayati]|uniref:Uncharacterized protein n=1 Tax=Eretmocerus hayati TaxID=131215 RepID=A0ACC2NC15_9HYME|nr:hypothetical protein QAD02_010368 [Eretmocerus hayati]
MAMIERQSKMIHVPWSSTNEWAKVYKQIYSNDCTEQNKAYETLLVWKTRTPKLPIGVECTLGLVQVCLRDREWFPKISSGELPISYENDLQMLYSTVIMKFLNHISHMAHNKQVSLFMIAKQLKIPDWIVELRHNIAHGHELPSIDVMRVVSKILLSWIHEEYWAPEAQHFQESRHAPISESFHRAGDDLIDLIEMWVAVGLYTITGYRLVSDLPDEEFKSLLSKLKTDSSLDDPSDPTASQNNDELSTVSRSLLLGISEDLNKNDLFLHREKTVIDTILSNEAFITNLDILAIFIKKGEDGKNSLPKSLMDFWSGLILILHEKKMLLTLFLQLIELIKRLQDQNQKLIASLWVKAIAQAFYKLKVAQLVHQTLEQRLDHDNESSPSKISPKTVFRELDACYPELKSILCLNINYEFPTCLTDISFIRKILLNYTEFSEHYIPEVMKLSTVFDKDSGTKEKILSLLKINSAQDAKADDQELMSIPDSREHLKVYTVEDVEKVKPKQKNQTKKSASDRSLADSTVRNSHWKIVKTNGSDWNSYSLGSLPWQSRDSWSEDSLIVSPAEIRYAIVKNVDFPQIIDPNRLKFDSSAKWKNVLEGKKGGK